MEEIKNCVIERYDDTIKKPPYLTIPIDEIKLAKPNNDKDGVEFLRRMIVACQVRGYFFKFYSMPDNNEFDYMIVVK